MAERSRQGGARARRARRSGVSSGRRRDPTHATQARLLEEDVAEIVHDLKNPLSTISLETSLLEQISAGVDSVRMAHALERIAMNVAYLDRLALDLLDLCDDARGALQLELEQTELCGLLRQVIDRVVGAGDRSRVVFSAPRRGLELALDRHRIERVVANLLDNALKYTIPTSHIVVEVGRSHGSVVVSVSDDGPGVVSDDLTRLFVRSQRGLARRKQPGHGLGLHVSKRIIEAHGGRIGAEAVPGAGARFYFELPIT